MQEKNFFISTHPKGEAKISSNSTEDEIVSCDTFAGKVHVEWDSQAPVTPLGQLVFFIEFLKTSELFDDWVNSCPLNYIFKESEKKRDLLGTLFLAALTGQNRYTHITGIRNDNVNASLLGMRKVVSEDTARRSFKDIDASACEQWQKEHLKNCYEQLLIEPWILDIDTTVKPLYGNQEGAEIGYNPQKPGRPAHIIHSYMMGGTRLILDCEVQPGKQSFTDHILPGLNSILDGLDENEKPKLVRGDSLFGNEKMLSNLEERSVNYLFKLKKTQKVKSLIELASLSGENWVNAGKGFEGVSSEISLYGWTKKRRVIVLRRLVNVTRGRKPKDDQLLLPFRESLEEAKKYEYGVLVTSLEYDVLTLAQMYRDRSDSENNFDELKNQWGWGGFVTQDLKRSQVMSRIVAQVYNWWSLFIRLADPEKHREGCTSRPFLLYGVAKQTQHANQKTITITSTHAHNEKSKKMLTRIRNLLFRIKDYSEQFSKKEKWRLILSCIFMKFLKGRLLGSQKDMIEIIDLS